MEAFIKSIDEPQLERCLEAVKNQSVPFSNVIHVNGMVPESAAHNYGMSLVRDEWVALIDGDVILNPNAVEVAQHYMKKYSGERIYSYSFALLDSFLCHQIGGVSFIRSIPFKRYAITDRLCNDRYFGRKLMRKGWIFRRFLNEILGTHFAKPDEFQVFRRFFTVALKFTGQHIQHTREKLLELKESTRDPLYTVGVKAIDFGMVNKFYPGSHNIVFDRKMFEEFKTKSDWVSG